MKANEAPEKIYLTTFGFPLCEPIPQESSNPDTVWSERPYTGADSIEYTRTDARDRQTEKDAEKGLELTWEDIHAIAIIEDKLIHELCLNDQTLPNTQEFYEEVLKRFKDYMKEK